MPRVPRPKSDTNTYDGHRLRGSVCQLAPYLLRTPSPLVATVLDCEARFTVSGHEMKVVI